MKLLIAKQFVIAFETGTLVITHHRANNTLRNDRYKPTLCIEERDRLESLPSGAYALRESLLPAQGIGHSVGMPNGSQVETDGFPNITEHNQTEPRNDTSSDKSDFSNVVADVVNYLN